MAYTVKRYWLYVDTETGDTSAVLQAIDPDNPANPPRAEELSPGGDGLVLADIEGIIAGYDTDAAHGG